MQTLFDFAVTGSKLSSLDTCLLLQINDITTLDTTPLTLAGGDILEVGDQFTGIDEAGSAGKPPLKITDGWYQQYEGSIYIASDTKYRNSSLDSNDHKQ